MALDQFSFRLQKDWISDHKNVSDFLQELFPSD